MAFWFVFEHCTADNWMHALSGMETRSRELHSNLEVSVAQTVKEAVNTQLERVVQTEINGTVLPR